MQLNSCSIDIDCFPLQEGGLEMEGLYRVPGNQAQLNELERSFREKVSGFHQLFSLLILFRQASFGTYPFFT